MKRSEFFARLLVVLLCLAVIAVPLGVYLWPGTPVLHARMAEDGGWTPQILQAQAGVPMRLKLTSDDVVHGFAVGQHEMQAVDVEPGKITEVSLTFKEPGTYTFYCTRWCGVNHWRMRGTIEVSGEEAAAQQVEPPLYVRLGIDIDAPHPAGAVPEQEPSAREGGQLYAGLSELERLISTDYYRSHSPAQAFADLGNTSLTDPQKWNLVAYAWYANTTLQELEEGGRLFQQNCAACHGTAGGGDGVFADDLTAAGEASMQDMQGSAAMAMQQPADLADPETILGASPALLHGKIQRGGMGTGMPMWGSILTERQIWNIIAYLYSLQFRY